MAAARWLLVAALLLAGGALCGQLEAAQGPAPENSCITCHRSIGDPRVTPPAEKFAGDIHLAQGIFCQDCHGGDPTSLDPERAMSRAKGFIGKPTHQAIPPLCGKCHSNAEYMKRFNPTLRVDQVQEYYTSVHGKLLRKGDQKVATCISCHDVHKIRAIKDQQAWTYPLKIVDTCGRCHGSAEYMATYKIPTDVVAKYKASVHFQTLTKGDLSAPTCNICHGNHGATPPGINSVANVCGNCHSVPAELFAKSPHRTAFASMNLPACVSCHSDHDIHKTSDTMVGTTEPAVCANCHQENSDDGRKVKSIRTSLDGLRTGIDRAEEILTRAERAGMEISQAKFDLHGASDILLKMRASVHLADPATVDAFAVEGEKIADKQYEKGVQALKELAFRHQGLWVAVGIILVTIVGLILKMREVDRRQSPPPSQHA
ncbi:MAG TPA: cytochrome c3 family protein [Candidatus Baltobacteraceae bacterium]|nr:cytochrome c3 family protein [Candidatus Baltobacteraceae bacterium]